MRTTIDITVKQPGKAIDALSEAAPGLSRQKIKDAMTKGACWWTHKGKRLRLRRATKELKPGIRLQLYYDEKVLERKPEKPILLENAGRYTVWF
ncbi:MAG TPA: RNA pseudouridine synthase, partial [Marinobacter adhaerens]|nr:RNA pseudouridine synthase [Marinobacter adhaerens]